MMRLNRFKQYTRYFSSIIPSNGNNNLANNNSSNNNGNNGISNHLSSAKNTNKLLVPQLKYLAHKTPEMYGCPGLVISHSLMEIPSNTQNPVSKYILNLSLNATINEVKPALFICCLDISSSMHSPSTYNNTDSEESKFTRWDLVKHSMNTLIHCLRPVDKLAIFTFSSNGHKNLGTINMDQKGKKLAFDTLEHISVGGNTNLWNGIELSLQEFEQQQKIMNNYDNIFTMVLTDGEPNINPVRGILTEFKNKISHNYLANTTVHMFGYGYGLDSTLMTNLAEESGGLFVHIPDHTMCNTVFINYISNCFATAINKVDININPSDTKLLTNFTQNNSVVGSVQSGLSRNLLFGVNSSNNFSTIFDIKYNNKTIKYEINSLNTSKVPLDSFLVAKIGLRKIILEGLNNTNLQDTCQTLDVFTTFLNNLLNSDNSDKTKIMALLNNIKSNNPVEGQIYKAFSKDEWFSRWGIHYLKYFIRSHELQICSNFKDTSLQEYAGPLFTDIKKEVEDIFSSIPVPQPSLSSSPYAGNFQQTHYSPSGPCIDGDGYVKLANGKYKQVKELIKDDVILNSDNNSAKIICVIKTTIQNGFTDMLSINGLKVTPWHPIRLPSVQDPNPTWVFPSHIGRLLTFKCDHIYNFVLDSHHFITVNDIDVITLGHGIQNDPVLTHPFFGTRKVIEHLESHPDFETGLIEIKEYKPVFENGLISGFWSTLNTTTTTTTILNAFEAL